LSSHPLPEPEHGWNEAGVSSVELEEQFNAIMKSKFMLADRFNPIKAGCLGQGGISGSEEAIQTSGYQDKFLVDPI
jgi:hypothetical protein